MNDIKIVRTPESRFLNLKGWPFEPHYVDDLPGYAPLRIHYVDEGPLDSDRVYLCLHGEPSWAYLFRKMIPGFVDSGARVVAPDWLGFGRSDKPIDDNIYTFDFHRNMMLAFIRRLDLRNITLVVQDWGGLLGLTLPHEMPERFSRLIIMNTALAIGKPPSAAFLQWRDYVAANPDFNVGQLMTRATPHLDGLEIAAYDAPFPDITYKAGVRRFPAMVMVEPDMDGVDCSIKAVNFWKNNWLGKSFMAIGAADPVLGTKVMNSMRKIIRNCPDPLVLPDAGHFVQEWGEVVAEKALESFGDI